jgi:hypothetical protein
MSQSSAVERLLKVERGGGEGIVLKVERRSTIDGCKMTALMTPSKAA